MKVDAHLSQVQGPEAAKMAFRRSPRPSSVEFSDGGAVMISRENRRAWQAISESPQKAKEILQEVRSHLAAVRQETLAAVHQLSAGCLVKL